ncbi:MAG: c-type cytochrome [Opitutaceae bacterium]|nr:c-type cytochrome [Opitutaceae bacterium]
MRISCSLCIVLAALAHSAFAQSGDKPGEAQADPPSHLVIPPAPALTVDQALRTFRIAPGFRIEAVASDPLLHDPVVLEIDEAGRYWVVEMRGFMPNVDGVGEDKPVGTIAVLDDTDGDGRPDRRTEFATGLVMPRAMLRVADGILVGAPPHLWFMRDTDGDGRADEKTEVASDYGSPTNPEHTANSLTWGLDNWIYSANFTARFRYNPDGSWTREPTSFRGQWGLTFNNAGNFFYNNNSVPLQADAFPAEYLYRNPAQPFSPCVNRTLAPPEKITLYPSRVTPGINRGYRTLGEDGVLRSVTAACAPLFYRESLFPSAFAGNVFICEPAANLVKRILVDDASGAWTARNAYPSSEFLTSTDERFRPVNLTSGPDGALYVVDMYRGILQHRIYVTSYLRRQIESRHLDTPIGLGRIYRIVPEGFKASPSTLRLPAQMTLPERVATLDHESGWWRDTAQRLLVQTPHAEAIPLLNQMACGGARTALGRVQALWTLQGMKALAQGTVEVALRDRDPRVVSTTIRLAEPWLKSGEQSLTSAVIALTGHTNDSVRLQAAFSLGESPAPAAREALFALARAHGDQACLNDALVSSLPGHEFSLLEGLLDDPSPRRVMRNKPVIVTAAAAVLLGNKPDPQARLFAMLSPDSKTTAANRLSLLEGIELAQRKDSERATSALTIAVVPQGLISWSNAKGIAPEIGNRLRKTIGLLRWPGRAETAKKPAAVALNAQEKLLYEKGRENFAICAGCHQPDGKGLAGLAPPLINSRWVLGQPDVLARIVLQGKENAPLVMPPLGALDDATVASILTYVRHSWGHAASAVSAETIASVRVATKGRDEPWKESELEALSR